MNKQWLPIKNYENKYEVSNTGLVRNIKALCEIAESYREEILKSNK